MIIEQHAHEKTSRPSSGLGGVKGLRRWVASQKFQENGRREHLKNESILDGTGKLTSFEMLRSKMFSESDEVNRPRVVESLHLDTSPSSPVEVVAGRRAGSWARQ